MEAKQSREISYVPDVDWNDEECVKKNFVHSFQSLKKQFLDYVRDTLDYNVEHIERLDHLFEYTCLNGKMNRGLYVVKTTRDVCKTLNLDFCDTRKRHSTVLGWCIEILQAMFLVADDIMDKSITRRGKPCWYRQESVQMDAVNDTLILESFLYYLLQFHFSDSKHYLTFTHLYQKTSLQTQLGQMLDLLSQPQGRKGPEILHKFTLEGYLKIITNKTAYYTFYNPLTSAMILCGLDTPKHLEVSSLLSVKLGQKFQIQDDYLDAFADPEHLGKIGTDILDHKCTWLVVQAMKRASPEQIKFLETHYGCEEEEKQEAVKQLYRDLKLPELYEEQEESSYQELTKLISDNKDIVPECVFTPLLEKVHKRTK